MLSAYKSSICSSKSFNCFKRGSGSVKTDTDIITWLAYIVASRVFQLLAGSIYLILFISDFEDSLPTFAVLYYDYKSPMMGLLDQDLESSKWKFGACNYCFII